MSCPDAEQNVGIGIFPGIYKRHFWYVRTTLLEERVNDVWKGGCGGQRLRPLARRYRALENCVDQQYLDSIVFAPKRQLITNACAQQCFDERC